MTHLSFPSFLPDFAIQPQQSRVLSRSVRNFICKELNIHPYNNTFLLAVSGGADSLALLCLWLWLRPLWKHTVIVTHIDHGLRQESVQEAQAVAELCAAWHVTCTIHTRDINALAQEKKQGIEETARQERYKILEIERKKHQAQWICLAHHTNDLQEDILMRLMRGTGWPALGGMVAMDKARHILRPLLMQESHALRSLLTAAQVSWCEDQSNTDTHFLRNRVRHTLIPQIQAENPAFFRNVQQLWRIAQADTAHWTAHIQHLCTIHKLQAQENSFCLPAYVLKTTDQATRLRLYMHAVHTLNTQPTQKKSQARAQILFSLDTAWQEGRGGTVFQLAGGLSARLSKGSIVFVKQ